MVTVCPSQFATRRTLFHVLVGCGLLMLKVSRLKLPVIWLLVSMWLNTLTKSQIWTLLLKVSIPLQQLNGLETLVIIMVANKYAFLQITRRRFLNEWEAFKKVISRRNIRRRITIPLTLS